MNRGHELMDSLSTGTHKRTVKTLEDAYEELSTTCSDAIRYCNSITNYDYRRNSLTALEPSTIETLEDAKKWMVFFNRYRGEYPGILDKALAEGTLAKVLGICAKHEAARARQLHDQVKGILMDEGPSILDAKELRNTVTEFLYCVGTSDGTQETGAVTVSDLTRWEEELLKYC